MQCTAGQGCVTVYVTMICTVQHQYQWDSVTRDVSSVSVCVSLVLSTRDLGRVSAVPPQQRQGRARGGRHELVPAVETQ